MFGQEDEHKYMSPHVWREMGQIWLLGGPQLGGWWLTLDSPASALPALASFAQPTSCLPKLSPDLLQSTEGTQPRNNTVSFHMSPQTPKLVIFQGHQGFNTTQLPPFTKSQLLKWAATKGPIASSAELKDPQSILLRLDQGQLPWSPSGLGTRLWGL